MSIKVLEIRKDWMETEKTGKPSWMARIKSKKYNDIWITGFSEPPTISQVISVYFSEIRKGR